MYIPQGSILCPLIFLIYINELPNEIVSTTKQFTADDILLFFNAPSAKTLAYKLHKILSNIYLIGHISGERLLT